MEELKEQLKKIQAKRHIAKQKYTNFEEDFEQVLVLETKLSETLGKLLEKKEANLEVLSVRARLQETEKLILKELVQAQVATQTYEEYHEQLSQDFSAAEAAVDQARSAIHQFQETGKKRTLNIGESRQEAAWETSRIVIDDYTKILSLGWNSIFPALWFRCGWRGCLTMKSSLRKQFMCQHLVSRHFLHLDIQELYEEKQRWHPDHFAETSRKFKDLAAELMRDIEHTIKQRTGGDGYLWEQKRRQLYPHETGA